MLFDISKQPAPEVAKQLSSSKLMWQWEAAARLYYNYYENRKEAYLKSLDNLLVSPFTRYRLFSHWFDKYQKISTLRHQQLLGEISDRQVKDINAVFQAKREPFIHSNQNPAQLRIKKYERNLVLLTSFGVALYAFFVLKFNKLWIGLPILSSTLVYLTSDYRQPNQLIINAYKYLEEKRAASVWYDLKNSEVQTKLAKGKGMDAVKKHLESQGFGMVRLEQDVADLVEAQLAKKK